ncbi:IclR family transcriptional regulator [Orrella sp. JC864]|uniref:IclR family transcriptional regulator n=1 Tax=Orrella sp. JC864 TaxID=3120298 RepID=UPI0012BD6928
MAKESVDDDPTRSPLFNATFAKGVEVLAAFGPGRETMNLRDIATATGMTKSAAQRYAYTLEVMGLLRKDAETKRYSLTPRTMELGYRYLLVDPLVQRANPYLQDLNRQCGETVNLAELDGTDMVYVARFATHLKTAVHMPMGRRLPVFCTSSGRAMLSAMPPEQARALLQAAPRPKYTSTTVTDVDALMRIVERAREDGYSTASGEYYRGDLNLGVAVYDAQGRPAGAVNISAPSSRWTLARMRRELAPLLMETCRLISTTPPKPQAMEPFQVGTRPN